MSTRSGRTYNPTAIERAWQARWDREGTNSFTLDELRTAERPFYNLMMFPYPSAEGLHVGNIYAFTGADVHGRFRRMQGRDVFEPIGFDAFGIHSENFALKAGVHPMDLIPANVANFTPATAAHGGHVRLGPHRRHHRARLLQVDSVALSPVLQTRAGGAEGGAGQLVSVGHDRARQRAGGRGGLRALRHPGRAALHPPVVPEDHRVRGTPAGQPLRDRLVGHHQEGSAGLDQAFARGPDRVPRDGGSGHGRECARARPDSRLHHASRYRFRGHLHGSRP